MDDSSLCFTLLMILSMRAGFTNDSKDEASVTTDKIAAVSRLSERE